MTKNNAKTAVADALCDVLADSYVLYLKTQNYHWNVTGPHFSALHALFQGQYEDLAMAIDTVAERVRTLGVKAPGSFSAFAERASIKEEKTFPNWKKMVSALANDQEKIVATAQKALELAQESGDEVTADVMIGRIETHQKNKWMLDAHLTN